MCTGRKDTIRLLISRAIGRASMKMLPDKPRRGSKQPPQAQGYIKHVNTTVQSKTDSVTKACDSVVHQAWELGFKGKPVGVMQCVLEVMLLSHHCVVSHTPQHRKGQINPVLCHALLVFWRLQTHSHTHSNYSIKIQSRPVLKRCVWSFQDLRWNIKRDLKESERQRRNDEVRMC